MKQMAVGSSRSGSIFHFFQKYFFQIIRNLCIKVTIEGVVRNPDPARGAIAENMVVRNRVRGDRDHVGGLIQKVVDTLSKENIKQNWAEYELWWPEQRKWLLKHHWMLDKYSIQVDTVTFLGDWMTFRDIG